MVVVTDGVDDVSVGLSESLGGYLASGTSEEWLENI